MSEIRFVVVTFLLLSATPMSADDERAATNADDGITPEKAAFFETRIRPVLIERCFDCHSGDQPESSFSLESRAELLRGGKLGTAVLPGKPAQSLLVSALKHDEFIKMPPKEKLPAQQVMDFVRWVEMGAPWPNSNPASVVPESELAPGQQFSAEQQAHWAFQPVTDTVPPVVNSDWPQSPIDHFILAQLNTAGLKPAPPANKITLIRRATFDLTGLPPTATEVRTFLDDDSQDAFTRVVDRLLASPRYGEHWGRHWLDVVRYADSNGLDENLAYANAFRYRDYVISAFNNDKPYARFVQEQIAGDLLPEVDDERQNMDRFIATGFLAIGPKMLAEDDPAKMQMDIIDEQISTLGQTFMALTIGCARCHDHKFDPLPTQDYYSLAGIFKSSKTMENHNVVAVWYERPLVSQTINAKIADIDRQIAETTRQLDQRKADCREHIAKQMQSDLGRYLLAAAALDRFQQQDESRREALTGSESPLPVRDGFALIEAEAFHRGNVKRLSDGYGEGIGIIATSGTGFAEYDLDVDRAGEYQLEVRHAAADSRPLMLIINGETVPESIAGQVTGNWYPIGQRWFTAGRLKLNAGKNTLRLYSSKVYPHIDRLALVYRGPEPWPFPTPPPQSMTQIAFEHKVSPELVSLWREFLKRVEADELQPFPSFKTWLAFTRLNDATFLEDTKALLNELSASKGLGATTPQLLKQALLEAKPESLNDVSLVFQKLLNTLQQAGLTGELKEEWYQNTSPLNGPLEISAAMLSPEEQLQMQQLRKKLEQLELSRPTYDVAMGVTEAPPEDLQIHLRGSHIALGEIAPRRFPRIIAGVEQPEIGPQESGRLQLAQWLTSPNHPLVGRVIVNRVWHWRFGRGLSPTVDNFGLLGQPPTHPKLLDWLTRRFLDSGGSLKKLHRMMLLSSTWQMSTQFDAAANTIDPENNLLWRFRRRRLSAEEMRDSVISLGGGLDQTMGGSLLKVKNRAYVTVSGTNLTDEYDNLRRSIYLPVVRSSVYDVLQTFDFPDPAVATGRRQTSTVAPQALMMMNSELVEQQTLAMAKRLSGVPDDQQRITAAFAAVLNREPDVREIDAGRQYIQQALQTTGLTELSPSEAKLRAWQSYCRVLLSSNEFAYIE